jgi:hypothetical protein
MESHDKEAHVRSVENVRSAARSPRQPLPWRRVRQPNRMQRERDRRLVRRVAEVFAGCGLIQDGYCIASGRTFLFPQVVSVVDGPPVAVCVDILPGQTPADFAKHASRIAYHLGVAEVRVVPRKGSRIRLELLPHDGGAMSAESLDG